MIKKILFVSLLVFTSIFVIPQSLLSQNNLFDDIRIGASLNYSTLNYESEGDVLNDWIAYDFGYQIHAMVTKNVSTNMSLQTGLGFFVFTYEFESDTSPETGPQGEPTGNYLKSFMVENFYTTYLSLPLRFIIHPFQKEKFYFVGGPSINYKIGYSNGLYKTVLYSENDKKIRDLFDSDYTVPELANDFLLTATAGVGFNLEEQIFPLTFELKAKHAITPYLDGDNFISSWSRGLSFSISYRL